ncbi:uncharacterized protein B4U79_01212 [Dinothrombium tinctorium]|uniref:DNA endonuclease activator Ctp1 C-terminal domain-containing protein n=1 Tax=Dinothrombium tinctorium TaxID=1965070 RepID=A0A443QYJ8_9ACAR|nr:uncharacterized protein B4U79_01212 [Dinothrombium tinctorium]
MSEKIDENNVICVLCDESFALKQKQSGKWHKLIISDLFEIADFNEYFAFWKTVFREKDALKKHCATVTRNTNEAGANPTKNEKYFILCPDIIPKDKELRDELNGKIIADSPKKKIVPLVEVRTSNNTKRFSRQSSNEESSKRKCVEMTVVDTCVRKKQERNLLNGYECEDCYEYFKDLGLPEKELRQRLNKCSRHRGHFSPPKTPEHFWEMGFPSTPECKRRGLFLSDS